MERRQIILAVVLLFSVTTYFLPWFTAKVSFNGEILTEASYGYYYVVPIVTPYFVPTGVFCVIGLVLSTISFKRMRRFQLLNIIAGILILLGTISSFVYTFNVAASKVPSDSISWSVNVWGEYGMGLMFLFGLLIAIIGAFQKLYGALRGLYLEMKPLVKIGVCGAGIICLIIGIAFIIISIHSLLGGNVQFFVQERMLTPEEGARFFLSVGTIVSIIGATLTVIGFKKMK